GQRLVAGALRRELAAKDRRVMDAAVAAWNRRLTQNASHLGRRTAINFFHSGDRQMRGIWARLCLEAEAFETRVHLAIDRRQRRHTIRQADPDRARWPAWWKSSAR